MICKDSYNFWKNKQIIKKTHPKKQNIGNVHSLRLIPPLRQSYWNNELLGGNCVVATATTLLKNNEFHELNGLSCDARGILVGMHAAQ